MKKCRLARKLSSKFFSIIFRVKSELELFGLGLSTGTGSEKQRTSRKSKKNVKMTSFWIKHGSTRPPPRYFFFKSHFEPCHRIVSIDKKLLSTYYLYEKPGIPMERFIVECFRKKVNIFLAFTEFTKIFVPLILFRTISARLFPRRQQCPRWRIQGMNLYHSKLSVTLQLFYSLRHWYQTLQHNCGTQGEHDLGFGRRYLRFTSASTIPRAFQFNDAGKHLNPKLQIKWYDSIRFDRSVFLGKKKWPSICQMKSTESTLLHCRFLPNQLPNTWEVAVLIDFPLLSHHLALRLKGWEASCCRNRDRSH